MHNEKRIKEYVRMIHECSKEALDGTLDLRVFLKSCEMATLESFRLLNETIEHQSKKHEQQ